MNSFRFPSLPAARAAFLAACLLAAVAAAHAAEPVDSKERPRHGDHPAVVVQRLVRQAGYDWAAQTYPHPAWLYLRPAAEAPAELARDKGCDRNAPAGGH